VAGADTDDIRSSGQVIPLVAGGRDALR
jgi:hypothetical protein